MQVDDNDKIWFDLITNVPQVNRPIAVAQAVLNLILPGFGTWLASCANVNGTVSKT